MYSVIKSDIFMDWFNRLRDNIAKDKIRTCIDKLEMGNFGDYHSVGNGVSEIRIHYGAGYRLYYTLHRKEIVILLCGGDKSSQKKDIKKAYDLVKLAHNLWEE